MKTIIIIYSLVIVPFLCFAEVVMLDLTALSNSTFQFEGPGVSALETNDGVKSFNLTNVGVCTLTLDAGTQVSSILQIGLDSRGVINEVLWKDADGSQSAGGFIPLPTGFYTTSNGGLQLNLTGTSIMFQFLATHVGNVEVMQTEVIHPKPTHSLFPGDYGITWGNGGQEVEIEVNTTTGVNSEVLYTEAGVSQPMHPVFYSIPASNAFQLMGVDISLDLASTSGYELTIEDINPFYQTVPESGSKTMKLLPGEYIGNFGDVVTGEAISQIKFQLENQGNNLSEGVEWNDLAGSQTGGGFITLDLDNFHKTRWNYTIITIPGPVTPPIDYDQWAVLKKKLDGSWYLTDNKHLRFKYLERYNDATDLTYTIYDDQHVDVTPTTTIPRVFGINWCELDLTSAAGFTVDEYYTLAVTTPKGDEYYLRFKFQ